MAECDELGRRCGVPEYLLRRIARKCLSGDEDENRDAEQDEDAESEALRDPERQARKLIVAEPTIDFLHDGRRHVRAYIRRTRGD